MSTAIQHPIYEADYALTHNVAHKASLSRLRGEDTEAHVAITYSNKLRLSAVLGRLKLLRAFVENARVEKRVDNGHDFTTFYEFSMNAVQAKEHDTLRLLLKTYLANDAAQAALFAHGFSLTSAPTPRVYVNARDYVELEARV